MNKALGSIFGLQEQIATENKQIKTPNLNKSDLVEIERRTKDS